MSLIKECPKCAGPAHAQVDGQIIHCTGKAVAYLRVSGKGQVEGDGFPRQRSAVTKFAESHDYYLVAEFRDEGVSGTNELTDRQGLSALSAYLIDHPDCRTILVERADRWARDLIIGELLLREFRERGVRVIACDAGVDLTSNEEPTSVLIRQILGAVAQFMKSELVLKLRAARVRKKANGGKGEGPAPYGATDRERAIMANMRALRRDGASYALIAVTLNGTGQIPRLGERWHAATVRKILCRHTEAP